MARLKRYTIPNYLQHIIQHGNNRQNIFNDKNDYAFFYECLHDAAKRYELLIHGYVFMPNHFHLLATPKIETSISLTMQSVGRRYVQYFNQKNKRTGTLWNGRYRSTIIEDKSYFFLCLRYIELNPTHKNIVLKPDLYPWSSYRKNALGINDPLITEHPMYTQLGYTPIVRQIAYGELFRNKLTEEEYELITSSTEKGWVLGSDNFKSIIKNLTQRRVEPLPRGRPVNK